MLAVYFNCSKGADKNKNKNKKKKTKMPDDPFSRLKVKASGFSPRPKPWSM